VQVRSALARFIMGGRRCETIDARTLSSKLCENAFFADSGRLLHWFSSEIGPHHAVSYVELSPALLQLSYPTNRTPIASETD
jgi:hypothetical protein